LFSPTGLSPSLARLSSTVWLTNEFITFSLLTAPPKTLGFAINKERIYLATPATAQQWKNQIPRDKLQIN